MNFCFQIVKLFLSASDVLFRYSYMFLFSAQSIKNGPSQGFGRKTKEILGSQALWVKGQLTVSPVRRRHLGLQSEEGTLVFSQKKTPWSSVRGRHLGLQSEGGTSVFSQKRAPWSSAV
jgi:hypothetical protein